MMLERVRTIPWWVLAVAALTLGIAPLGRTPHLVEKLGMLVEGELTVPLDVFDLLLHATPWILLALRLAAGLAKDRTDEQAGLSS